MTWQLSALSWLAHAALGGSLFLLVGCLAVRWHRQPVRRVRLIELTLVGESGRLVCLQRGVYSDVPISTLSQGKKRVNVPELYDTDQYRPRIRHVFGMPMFLT